MTHHEALGEAIRDARDARGMTQEQLAEKLGEGWPQEKISKIETGKQRLFIDGIELIAAALGEDPLKLIADAYERRRRSISE